MEIVNVNTDQLKFAEYNPRKLEEKEYAELKESLQRFGVVDPIIVNMHEERKWVIVGGHQRVRVARDLGIADVPCVFVNLPLEKEQELNLRLNRTFGKWDFDKLANEFPMEMLQDVGFSDIELGLAAPGGRDEDPYNENLDNYLNSNIKQIVLYFPAEQFTDVVQRLENTFKDFQVEDNTQAFLKLLEYYESHREGAETN